MGAYFQSICGCTKGKSELETACCSLDPLMRPLPSVLRQKKSEGNGGCVPGDRLAGTYSRQEGVTERYQHKSFLMESFFHLGGFEQRSPKTERKVVTFSSLIVSETQESTSPGIWSETQQPFPPVHSPCGEEPSPNEVERWEEKQAVRKTSLV